MRGRVVKGVRFLNLKDAGDPAELAAAHSEAGADEIVLLDISATHEKRNTLLETVRRTARQLFIPFTVGGGVRTLEDAGSDFRRGRGQDQYEFRSHRRSKSNHGNRQPFWLAGGNCGNRCKAESENTSGFEAWVQGGRKANWP